MNAQSYFIPKTKVTLALTLALVAPFCFAAGQEATVATDPASQPFEELPELQASEILKPDILKGPHHTVREPVPTFSGTNQFVIDSEYGVFEADGNEMLLRRVREVNAIAELKDISRGEQFTNALITAAKGPLKSAKNIIHDPAGSVSNMGKGAMKFMRGVGNSVKNVGKNKEDNNDREGSKAESLIGYSRTKRKIAINMGIDPYSTNTVLQHELEEVAWASWAGGFTFTAVTFPISGPVGVALTVTNVNGALGQLLHEKSPDELKAINGASLRAMGVNEKDIARLLNSDAFSPSAATAFVLNLKTLKDVENRGAFVRAAGEKSSNESDALFCVQTAVLMGQIHSHTPLARIVMLGDFPVCLAQDGTVIVALQWDYAAWTPGAATFTDEVQKLANEHGSKKPVMVVLSGQMSPRLQQELQKRGFTVQDRANPGPLEIRWLPAAASLDALTTKGKIVVPGFRCRLGASRL